MGSKWNLAKRYGKPKASIVIEAFAGSACYSLYHNVSRARLYDINPRIIGIWKYLIKAKESEILALPIKFDHVDDLKISQEAKWLLGFWINKGTVEPKLTFSAWARKYQSWNDCKVWGEKARSRIASQLPGIRRWEARCLSFESIPNEHAHWFIDPPYEKMGKHYTFSQIDYPALAGWCKTREGFATVCENDGATWLPFSHFHHAKGTFGKTRTGKSHEVVWEGQYQEVPLELTFSDPYD